MKITNIEFGRIFKDLQRGVCQLTLSKLTWWIKRLDRFSKKSQDAALLTSSESSLKHYSNDVSCPLQAWKEDDPDLKKLLGALEQRIWSDTSRCSVMNKKKNWGHYTEPWTIGLSFPTSHYFPNHSFNKWTGVSISAHRFIFVGGTEPSNLYWVVRPLQLCKSVAWISSVVRNPYVVVLYYVT